MRGSFGQVSIMWALQVLGTGSSDIFFIYVLLRWCSRYSGGALSSDGVSFAYDHINNIYNTSGAWTIRFRIIK